MTIYLTDKEIEDLRRGLIIAMQSLDATGYDNDKALASRLEEIDNKILQRMN